MNGGVHSCNQTNLTTSQGQFMIEMNIASEKTRWFSVNSHLRLVLFTLHRGTRRAIRRGALWP